MNREQLESEISRLATEETKVIELQKKLKRKSAAWNALEVKRIEYSAHLAIRSIQLADMMSSTQRYAKFHGVQYSSHTDPQYLIRVGLQKAGIRPVEHVEVPKQPERKRRGWVIFVLVMLFAFFLVIIIADMRQDALHKPSATRPNTSDSKVPEVRYPRYPGYENNALWPMLSEGAQLLIRKSVKAGEIPYGSRDKFFKHLRAVRKEYPYWTDVEQVRRAIFRTADNTLHD